MSEEPADESTSAQGQVVDRNANQHMVETTELCAVVRLDMASEPDSAGTACAPSTAPATEHSTAQMLPNSNDSCYFVPEHYISRNTFHTIHSDC